ncbi:MAG: 30S ribosomal protein S8, partial [Candidatus Nanoarchaeia archaeon]
MKQDIVANALNEIMNAKVAGKKSVKIRKWSNLLLDVLDKMKEEGYVDYKLDDELEIAFLKLNKCRAIKPRYYVTLDMLERYLRRFLPSRNFGSVLVSTSKGLM